MNSAKQDESHQTHFGFESVDWNDKQQRVGEVFSRVASRYDIMNDAMSLGMHRLWKDTLVNAVTPRAGMDILDMAGGTGDIAKRMLKRGARVTLCDINADMLTVGRDRLLDAGLNHNLAISTANAESLPFADNRFDAYTIAFGLRNVTDIPAALREAHRVLKPGSSFFCLEFSKPDAWLAPIYDKYSFHVIPWLGEKIAKDEASYRYLVESIRRFPPQEELCEWMRTAGFQRVSYRNLNGGIVALHRGWKF